MVNEADVKTVVRACAALGDPNEFERPEGYRGLALCVVDAIWSMGVRYSGVVRVIDRYRAERAADGKNADDDTPGDLVAFVDVLGGPTAFAVRMKNRQLTSTRGGILKADAVYQAAKQLDSLGVRSPVELSEASEEQRDKLASSWSGVQGQGSGISWSYFLMLSGTQGVKADRMIRRFLADALGRPSAEHVGVGEAVELVTAAADRLNIEPTTLDHQIWLYQRVQGTEPN